MQTTVDDKLAVSRDIQLSELIAKPLKKVKEIKLPSFPISVHLIDGELWCCTVRGIYVHNSELQHVRTIKPAEMGYIRSVAAVDDDMVAVAAGKGLFLVTKAGCTVRIHYSYFAILFIKSLNETCL